MLELGAVCEQSRYLNKYYRELVGYISVQNELNFVTCICLDGPAGSGKRAISKKAAGSLKRQFIEADAGDILFDNISASEKRITQLFADLNSYKECVLYLSNFEFFCLLDNDDAARLQDCFRDCLSKKKSRCVTFIVSTTVYKQTVHPTPLSSLFHKIISIKPLIDDEIEDLLNIITNQTDVQLVARDVIELLHDNVFLGNLLDFVSSVKISKSESSNNQNSIDKKLLKIAYDNFYDTKIKNSPTDVDTTSWTDIGGLKDAKQEIIDTIQLSIDYPQLAKSGLSRTGILLYGPPGTGKTLLARAVANECKMHFINVKGPELINMYVGQSEENIRKLFADAKANSPSIIFFDELDSLAPNRGQSGDSGGVMDRVVSQFLAELDGIGKNEVFVIGATNRVDLIEPALLRPGRFDTELEISIAHDVDSRVQILQALTRKLRLEQDVTCEWIESQLAGIPMSGADFRGICSVAVHNSIERCVKTIEDANVDDLNVELITNREDFSRAITEVLSKE